MMEPSMRDIKKVASNTLNTGAELAKEEFRNPSYRFEDIEQKVEKITPKAVSFIKRHPVSVLIGATMLGYVWGLARSGRKVS